MEVEASDPRRLEHSRVDDGERMDVDEQIDLRIAQFAAKLRPSNELGGPAPKPKLLRGLVDERSSRRGCGKTTTAPT